MNGIKANVRIRVEQNADPVLKNIKLKFLGQPHDEGRSANYDRLYKANEVRIHLKYGLLFRKIFGEMGSNTTKFSFQSN